MISDPGFPWDFRDVHPVAKPSCQHEQIVTQTIQIFDDKGVYQQIIFPHSNADPFRPPADTSRNVSRGYCYMAAG
jgi:hypothetical protein